MTGFCWSLRHFFLFRFVEWLFHFQFLLIGQSLLWNGKSVASIITYGKYRIRITPNPNKIKIFLPKTRFYTFGNIILYVLHTVWWPDYQCKLTFPDISWWWFALDKECWLFPFGVVSIYTCQAGQLNCKSDELCNAARLNDKSGACL